MSKKYPNAITPNKALNIAFRKQRVLRTEIDGFKQELTAFINKIDPEANEETLKSQLRDFLLNSYYRGKHAINSVDRKDLVIFSGPKMKDDLGVIIEVKAPKNTGEMITRDNINAKAIQELLLYYLRERITKKNSNIKHLIVTNIYEWYIFDAVEFEKRFASNKRLVKEFEAFERDKNTTSFFYTEKAKPIIDDNVEDLPYSYFDIKDYKKAAETKDERDDKKLIALYKLLSPVHILKKPFANDSNTLDKSFYNELLHIIGLEEVKVKNKKLINRKESPNAGSLIENAINILEYDINPSKLLPFGDNHEERKYNAALELSITWINRILFLKLLEAQLVRYHKGDQSYRFLKYADINNYDALNKLFFQVLAVKPESRPPDQKEKYSKIPYLNSSLFEPSEVESATIRMSGLEEDPLISIYDKTVLKGKDGKKRKGEIKALEYLFLFLDSYDFSSEGSEEIQEENKRLINASVLGLIFEKINGYKEGSVFTPGFITMYMCRQTLHQCVISRFNELKGYNATSVNELRDHLGIDKKARLEANDIINQLKACDPAVGSGHFLVSMLNEIIALKSYLGILSYTNGDRVRYYKAEVENDELMIINVETDELFDYHLSDGGKPITELQNVQEMLFHEKETLIENCLFGVDINPNSVKICRLRLWIELLKNSYYTSESGYTQLETLPNIDINIKCGNSLVSRFGLGDSLKAALKKSKFSIDAYKVAVQNYKDATDKGEKAQFKSLISSIKNDFQSDVNDKDKIKLSKLESQFYDRFGATLIEVELTKTEQKKKAKAQKELQNKIDKQKDHIKDIQDNQIYHEALEWRFEFPEVLDDEGTYIGFDMVVGNPPYIRQEEFKELKPYLESDFQLYVSSADIYVYFVELGMRLLKLSGQFNYIIPNKWMRARYGNTMRDYLQTIRVHEIIDFGDLPVFEEVTTYPLILSLSANQPNETIRAVNVDTLDFVDGLDNYLNDNDIKVLIDELSPDGWVMSDQDTQLLVKKIRSQGVTLNEYVDGRIYYGIKTGLNEAFVIDEETKSILIREDANNADVIKPFLAGRDIKRYEQPVSENYLILFECGQTQKWFGDLNESEAWQKIRSRYPAIAQHLKYYEAKAKKRYDQGDYWWELRACAYYDEFNTLKIIYPNICKQPEFLIDKLGQYTNQKCFIIGSSSMFLLAQLNSLVYHYLFKNILPELRGGFYEPSSVYFTQFPFVASENPQLIESIVNEIITIKKQDPAADTSSLESEIDQMVYQLYGLTEGEIAIIEKAIG